MQRFKKMDMNLVQAHAAQTLVQQDSRSSNNGGRGMEVKEEEDV